MTRLAPPGSSTGSERTVALLASLAERAIGAGARFERADDLHRFRVAVRRLDATLDAHAPLLKAAARRPLQNTLRALLKGLGRVRDLDVAQKTLGGWTPADRAGRRARTHFARWLEKRRTRRYKQLCHAKPRRALKGLGRAFRQIRAEDFTRAAARDPGTFDRSVIARRESELARAAAQALEDPCAAHLHSARLAAKRCRYAHEILGPEIAGEGDRILALARELQGCLGDYQDTVVLLNLLGKARAKEPGRHTGPGRALEEYLAARQAELLAKARPLLASAAALHVGEAPPA